ncbi:hypothetical protein XFF6992_270049 [Xanthomonas citri pv. fuscans]|uniref:Uncharacterized protein n=1 Tax=Xanthomonas citri pv. citri TaxID=611301 RepID=A0A0U5FBY5_XANCI|nr:hypothetical protein XAC9322_240036 [Xanthomonas citri pv. citri]SOO18856.1 hypothetical protein XFF6992_270049 [Xanthomonas citri pv. fuscans]CEE23128.1 hypothetical protein XAC1083_230036 [Xanthomonas citri pv. citri]CEE31473.1 hypothetical protein XAC3810_250036 [Xanthomonas citri pv. citri]CEE37895.1 hypothetical protein XAC908_370010 [Xanthomonas citri pv. citri]
MTFFYLVDCAAFNETFEFICVNFTFNEKLRQLFCW